MNISKDEQGDQREVKLIHVPQNIIGWTLVLWLHSHSAAAYVAVGAAAEAEVGVHGDSLPHSRDETVRLYQLWRASVSEPPRLRLHLELPCLITDDK